MLLILDNKKNKNDKLAYIDELSKALNKLRIPFISVTKIDNNIKLHEITGVIISGSSIRFNDITENKRNKIYAFNFYYLSRLNVPIYGICFGAQLLSILYNCTIKDNKKYICGNIPFYKYDKSNILLKNVDTDNFDYCFSETIIPNKYNNINIFASIKHDNKIVDTGFEFEKNKVFGSLFHPEINDNTIILYDNFYNLCKKYKNKRKPISKSNKKNTHNKTRKNK